MRAVLFHVGHPPQGARFGKVTGTVAGVDEVVGEVAGWGHGQGGRVVAQAPVSAMSFLN